MKEIITYSLPPNAIHVNNVDFERSKVLAYKDGKLMGMLWRNNLLPESHSEYNKWIFIASSGGGGCNGYHDSAKAACENIVETLKYKLILVD